MADENPIWNRTVMDDPGCSACTHHLTGQRESPVSSSPVLSDKDGARPKPARSCPGRPIDFLPESCRRCCWNTGVQRLAHLRAEFTAALANLRRFQQQRGRAVLAHALDTVSPTGIEAGVRTESTGRQSTLVYPVHACALLTRERCLGVRCKRHRRTRDILPAHRILQRFGVTLRDVQPSPGHCCGKYSDGLARGVANVAEALRALHPQP